MISARLRLFMRFAPAAIVLGVTATAHARPKLEMHRVGVSADDGSGWHLAVSSKGSFSIRLPIPFNDFTTRATRRIFPHPAPLKFLDFTLRL